MKLFLLIHLLFISTIASANSVAYITDQVDIPLRSEKTFDDNILRSLSSGTELEVIQATEDGWTQIRVDGITGWIISRYLTNIKPAKVRLQELEDKYSKLKDKFDSYEPSKNENTYGFKAEDETALAQLYLGDDVDIEKDLNKSFQLLLSAAKKGYAMAQSNLGVYYVRGYGTDINYKEAYKWYFKAAKQGNRKAQYNLAEQYEEGNSELEANKNRAFYWYKKASRKNLKEAQYRLAYFYIEGDVVKQDREKAFSLNLKSAIQGYDKAQYAVGIMFENGIGTVKDFERAAHWYKKAADQGHKKAEKLLNDLEKGNKLKANKPSGAGSGFVISKKGHVATNYHVVDSCKKILIDDLEAVIIDSNKDDDIAILKVSNDYDMAASLSYKSAELGEDVLVFGYPMSYIFSDEYISLTKGSVSSLSGFKNNLSEFRFTASTQPGNSGGPIVGKDGKVVGLVSAVLGREAAEFYEFLPQNVNFGMKVSLLLDMMRVNNVPISSSRVSENSVVKYYKEVTKHIMCYE